MFGGPYDGGWWVFGGPYDGVGGCLEGLMMGLVGVWRAL